MGCVKSREAKEAFVEQYIASEVPKVKCKRNMVYPVYTLYEYKRRAVVCSFNARYKAQLLSEIVKSDNNEFLRRQKESCN